MATPRAPLEHGRIRRPSPLSECGSAVTLTDHLSRELPALELFALRHATRTTACLVGTARLPNPDPPRKLATEPSPRCFAPAAARGSAPGWSRPSRSPRGRSAGAPLIHSGAGTGSNIVLTGGTAFLF